MVVVAGTTGRTPYMKLKKALKTDLTRDDRTTFVLRERPVGLLRYIQMYNAGKTAEANWFLSYVVLSTPYNNKCYTLPCHRWLTNRSVLSLRDGTGEYSSLPVLLRAGSCDLPTSIARVGIVGGGVFMWCLQTLIFEWKSALNFNPWAKFQTFRQLTPQFF